MTQLERNLIAFARAKLLHPRFTAEDRRDVLDALELLAEIRRVACPTT